jgi:hypothetical protein
LERACLSGLSDSALEDRIQTRHLIIKMEDSGAFDSRVGIIYKIEGYNPQL